MLGCRKYIYEYVQDNLIEIRQLVCSGGVKVHTHSCSQVHTHINKLKHNMALCQLQAH